MSGVRKKTYCYPYPHPAVTVDCVLLALHENDLMVLLIQRLKEPYKARWAFPGGFVEIGEGLEEGACRELAEETGVTNVPLEQLHTFGDPKRDPRERVISVAYYALVKAGKHQLRAADDAMNARWFSVRTLPPLAFDHENILATALHRLQEMARCAPAVFKPLRAKFRLSQLKSGRTASGKKRKQ